MSSTLRVMREDAPLDHVQSPICTIRHRKALERRVEGDLNIFFLMAEDGRDVGKGRRR